MARSGIAAKGRRTLWVTAAVVAALATSLAVPVSALPKDDRPSIRAVADAPQAGGAGVCEHPYPCGNGEEWPVRLAGTFALKKVLYERVVSHDGVELEGWIALPDLPDGVRAPVALHSTPYLGTCHLLAVRCLPTPDHPVWWQKTAPKPLALDAPHPDTPAWEDAVFAWGVPPIELVERGYAAAFFSVRGTGNSGGCFEFFGPNEQEDQAVIVEWLAAQPWSNGRVGMGGASYPGTTPNQAAIRNPKSLKSLKTIVVTGTNTDFYTAIASPQGAVHTFPTAFNVGFSASVSAFPPLGGLGGVAAGRFDHASVLPERACPALVEAATFDAATYLSDVRDADFWGERRLIERFGNIKAAVLLAHGFLDNIMHGSVHGFQDSAFWMAADRAPKHQVVGQWNHRWPNAGKDLPDDARWEDLLFRWLDYWLKGIGSPDGVGVVDYRDDAGDWRQSDAWPPKEAKEQVLFLAGERMAGVAGGASRSYQSVPGPQDSFMAFNGAKLPVRLWASLCGQPGGTGLAYVGAPLAEDTVVAGNPFAYLRLSADRPGGIVAVHLLELEPGFTCGPAAQPEGLKILSVGAADLRFHQGNFVGEHFPALPTNVRVDLQDLAERVDAGHRLALMVSYGEGLFSEWGGQPYYPGITVHSDGGDLASQVVLPVVSGSLGGDKPRVDYPSRPFAPSK